MVEFLKELPGAYDMNQGTTDVTSEYAIKQAMKKLYNSIVRDIDTKLSKGVSIVENPPFLPTLFTKNILGDSVFIQTLQDQYSHLLENIGSTSKQMPDLVERDSLEEVLDKHKVRLADIFPDRVILPEDEPTSFWEKERVLRVYDPMSGEEKDYEDEFSAEYELYNFLHKGRFQISSASRRIGYPNMIDAYQSNIGRFLIENFDTDSIKSAVRPLERRLREHEGWKEIEESMMRYTSFTEPPEMEDLYHDVHYSPFINFSEAIYSLVTEEGVGNLNLASHLIDVDPLIDKTIKSSWETIEKIDEISYTRNTQLACKVWYHIDEIKRGLIKKER